MEPVAVKVVSPGGDLIAELVVNPRKLVLSLKTQIEGIEGTAVGNQSLLLDGNVLDDNVALAASLDGFATSAEVVLVRRLPLLSGRLTIDDLGDLLADGDGGPALQRAIDAYAEDLQYSAVEAQNIVSNVASALLPPECSLQELLSEAPSLIPLAGGAAAHGVAARRSLFARALCEALAAVQLRLQRPADTDGNAPEAIPAPDAGFVKFQSEVEESGQRQAVGWRRPGIVGAELHIQPDHGGLQRSPWKGAGLELQQKLHRRWAASEQQTTAGVDDDADEVGMSHAGNSAERLAAV